MTLAALGSLTDDLAHVIQRTFDIGMSGYLAREFPKIGTDERHAWRMAATAALEYIQPYLDAAAKPTYPPHTYQTFNPLNPPDEKLTASVNPTASSAPDDLIAHYQKIRADREKLYSDSRLVAHEMLGPAWSSLLSHWLRQEIPPMPGHIVALMLVMMKATRAALEGFRVDDYADLVSYGVIAYDIALKEERMRDKAEMQ